MADESGYRETPPEDARKAEAFFKQGRTVAQAGQYDYAIEMFLQGLAKDPEAVAEHQALREISLKRRIGGGKDLGMMAKMKFRYGKDDLANMTTAERFLAYDPGNMDRMLELLTNSAAAGCHETVLWIGAMLYRANLDTGKPQIGKFMALRDAYSKMGKWKLATDAAGQALRLKPNDMDLQNDVKNLAAKETMQAGGYEKQGGFRQSIRDAAGQQDLMNQDKDIRTVDALTAQILAAREELKRGDPNEPGKIGKLVDALVKTENSEYENEAIEILDGAYKRTDQFRFRLRLGQIKLQQLRRMERGLREEVAKNPTDEEAKKTYRDFMHDRAEEEYKEMEIAAEAYPTDLSYKYEMARRLILLDRYPEAIPLLQQAVQDAKLRIEGTLELGKAFLAAEFTDEAVDTLKGLSEAYTSTSDTKGKDILYYLGRSFEARKDTADAIKCYSRVAMSDFNYRDVQVRLKRLRGGGSGSKD